MKNLTKIIATGVVAVLLAPSLVLADENRDSERRLETRIEHRLDKIEKGARGERRAEVHASTTAASIIKKATRVQATADSMLSFNDRIGALIASSSAETKTKLETAFIAFKSDAVNAKVQAAAAISGAAQVNASNSTTTNTALLVAAKVDLREAKEFLHNAQKGLMQILRSLWNLNR